MRFDLVLLDFDGTLADSAALLVGLVNETLHTAGFSPVETGAVAATIGLPLDAVFRHAVPEAPADVIADLCTRYRARADQPEFVRQFRLYPGVTATLAALRHAGARLAVVTSKGRATTTDIVRHCAIDALLDDIIGGDCVTHGKPHPEMVQRAQARFATPAHRTLVVGDTSFDIEMGQAAGAATCAVTYGMHSAERLRQLRPTFVIDQFAALTQVIERTDGQERC